MTITKNIQDKKYQILYAAPGPPRENQYGHSITMIGLIMMLSAFHGTRRKTLDIYRPHQFTHRLFPAVFSHRLDKGWQPLVLPGLKDTDLVEGQAFIFERQRIRYEYEFDADGDKGTQTNLETLVKRKIQLVRGTESTT